MEDKLMGRLERWDRIQRFMDDVHGQQREQEEVVLEVAQEIGSWFIPTTWFTKLKYIKYVGKLFKWKRGAAATEKVVQETVEETIEKSVTKEAITLFQDHHIISNKAYTTFKSDLKSIGWKQNDMWNLKKLPTPFHDNHPAYNSYLVNEMNLLKQSGNLNLNSMKNLQHNMRLMIGDAYRSGVKLNQYFKF